MKLSIIVPIYNVAPYLRKCVDSLLAQNYTDYEIILVDDGSLDECPKICDEYAAKYSNIKVVHQTNAGLSIARNAGVAMAKGDYVMYVDSDDYLQPNVLGILMAQVEREKLDVLRFNYQNVRQTANGQYEVFQPYKSPHQVDRCHNVVDGETYLDERMGYACYAWQFVINRELTGMFTPGIHFEDTEWLPRMMLAAKRVNSSPLVVYNYLMRQGSITQTQGNIAKIRKNVEDRMIIIDSYWRYIEQYPNCYWLKNMQSSMAVGVLTTVAMEFYSERKEYIRRLRELKVFPLSMSADQGRTCVRRAGLIKWIGARGYCAMLQIRWRRRYRE